MDEPTRTALVTTAKRYFDMAARGDSASLRQNAIASLASDFSGIETAVKDNQANLSGAQPAPRPPFLLKAEGTAPLERAEFLCGVFGAKGQTRDSAVFVIPNLPPGNYAIVTLDGVAPRAPIPCRSCCNSRATDWKLGGFYAKDTQIAGHDGNWFADHAREFKSQRPERATPGSIIGEARDLLVPVPFMSTADDRQAVRRDADCEAGGSCRPLDLTQAERLSKLTDLFPLPVGHDLDLVVKYQSAGCLQHRADLSGQPGGDESAAGKVSGVSRCVRRHGGARSGTLGPGLRVDAADERY